MAQVIIFENDKGGVAICVPTGELPIDVVKAKDTPAGSIIVESFTLPQGADAQFFDAWVMNGSTVSVDLTKAKNIATNNLNSMAKQEVSHRTTNTGIGVANKLSDADWLTLLTNARTVITNATTTQQLLDAITSVQSVITANA
jgi:hypothetical protein